MRRLPVLFTAILFAGCVTSQGTVNRELESTEPYVFTYRGDPHEAHIQLKRMLVQGGFQVSQDDEEAGLLVGAKTLSDDEQIRLTGFGAAMLSATAGITMQGQQGSLTFVFMPEDSVVTMTPRLVMNANVADNAFRSTEHQMGGEPIMQGHPLPIKYAIQMINLGFALESPAPESIGFMTLVDEE